MFDFLLFFFATLQNDFRQLTAEFGPIHRPKMESFEDALLLGAVQNAKSKYYNGIQELLNYSTSTYHN